VVDTVSATPMTIAATANPLKANHSLEICGPNAFGEAFERRQVADASDHRSNRAMKRATTDPLTLAPNGVS
jgi:hypothetical protein